jgi:hypothetical protein
MKKPYDVKITPLIYTIMTAERKSQFCVRFERLKWKKGVD